MTCQNCPDSTGTYEIEATYRDLSTETTETTVYCRGCDSEVHKETDTRRATHQPFQQ